MSTPARYLRHLLGSARRVAAHRLRTGAVRARRSVLPAAQMTAAGIGAYVISEQLLGHESPLFAAVAAMIAMGFTKEPQLRKVVEVALGCTLGVLLADMLVHGLGPGVYTAVLAVFLAVMLARFLDPGAMLAMQMGLQALLVVMVPVPAEALGPFTRSLDAVVGGGVALVITLITPKDPRGEPLRELKSVADALTASLSELSAALRSSDSRQAWHALIRARGLQSQIDESAKALSAAKELTDASVQLSRAATQSGPGFDRSMTTARESFAAVATTLHPARLDVDDLEGEALVLLIRTMVVDLLEATGADHEEAVAYLPDL